MNDTPVEATANPAPIVLDLNPPGTPAQARALNRRVPGAPPGGRDDPRDAERLAAEMLTLAAKSERERAEREAAVRQVEATAEEMEALRAEVTTLREQVAAAGSRRRGIFGS